MPLELIPRSALFDSKETLRAHHIELKSIGAGKGRLERWYYIGSLSEIEGRRAHNLISESARVEFDEKLTFSIKTNSGDYRGRGRDKALGVDRKRSRLGCAVNQRGSRERYLGGSRRIRLHYQESSIRLNDCAGQGTVRAGDCVCQERIIRG